MRREFATPEPPELRVAIPGGRVEIETAATSETVVEVEPVRGRGDDIRIDRRGNRIVVETRKRFALLRGEEYAVRIRTPHGAQAEAETASADLRIRGRVGALNVKTASGDVEVEHTEGAIRVRSASGDVAVRRIGGRADVNTASGDVDLGAVTGEISVRTASGDVAVAEAGDGISIYTASGDQRVDSAARGTVDLKSASGDVRVGIRRGSRLHVDARSMSGEAISELELDAVETNGEGPLVELRAVTMSGDIRIVRA